MKEPTAVVSADLSQIELRTMAHLSKNPLLSKTFTEGRDDRATAAKIFGVPPEEVTEDQRRWAKAFNFVRVYGTSIPMLAALASAKAKREK